MDDTKKATAHAIGVAQRLSRLSEELGQSNRQASDELQRTTRALPDLLRQAAQHTLGQLTSDTTQAVRRGLDQPLNDFSHKVIDNTHRIDGCTHQLVQSQEQVAAVVRKLTWLVVGVLASMLLVVVAGAGMVWHYRSVIAENKIEADLLRAYNQADIRLCGSQLCARVDRSDKRYGDYLLVKPRSQ